MKIKDSLWRDPAANPLVNKGQARISDREDEQGMQELRGELATFVCEGQYADGIQRIVRSFLDDLNRSSQRGAWVSGFFGSGKSHLLKMLCHLWRNTEFSDGATARGLVQAIPEDLDALLRELDVAGRRAGGLLAAAGSLPSGSTDHVRLTILGFLLRAAGLPAQYPQAQFCIWLHSEGHFDAVKSAVQAEGRQFESELNNLYVSGTLSRAIIACDKTFAAAEAEAKQLLKAQFPPRTSDITTAEFLRTAKDALSHASVNDGRMPCALIVLDEVQQYIGDSTDRSMLVTEVAETIEKQLDSHVMIVGAGQSALTDVSLLMKLMDRFTIRVPLSDADVETVTRKVLLKKKPTAVDGLRQLLEHHAGEVSRQLQGTKLGATAADRTTLIEDYPLLPVRRRFWDACFRQIDAAGTHSQLRSQLRILHDALARLADLPLGQVIPGDELFDSLAPEMVNTGVLLREINELIVKVGETEGPLARRLCGLVFLIGRLAREAGADTGVRATSDHLADLLVNDLAADNARLRGDVDATLGKLASNGILMRVGDEYRLQTRQGAEWDRDFRIRQTRLKNDAAAIQIRRDELLYGEIEKSVRGLRMVHGVSKEPRQFTLHRGEAPSLATDSSTIPVWVRDGWETLEREVMNAARSVGGNDPTIYVFVPRHSADDIRGQLIEAEAAGQTLDSRGNPTEPEGLEARRSMESRRAGAETARDVLVRDIVARAKVFQGGGTEIFSATLEDRLRRAAEDSLVRLFPRFKEADNAVWSTVIKRARDGAENPLQPVGHLAAVEEHPVCKEAVSKIGTGASGSSVRKVLSGSPFGWPRDAVDAALIALHRSQHLSATLNGATVRPGTLDQNRVAKAEFRVERAALSVQDRLILRNLFQIVGVTCKSGDEGHRSDDFLSRLADLARSAGGEPPLPAPPQLVEIDDVQRLVGNERLAAIKAKADDWEAKIGDWREAAALVAVRRPVWRMVERLVGHVEGIEAATPQLKEVDAVREGRQLLTSADPAAGICKSLADLLRATVKDRNAAHESAYAEAMEMLGTNEAWRKASPVDRDEIANDVGLIAPEKPNVSTDEDLVKYLEKHSLASVRAETDAVSARVTQAIERAARLQEPQVRPVALERATLRDTAEVEAWTERQRQTLLKAVADGPILVN